MKNNSLRKRAEALKLHGLLGHWQQVEHEPWVEELIDWEEQSRTQRSLERRIRQARLGVFKPLADFDWAWPKKIDRAALEEILRLDWLENAANIVLIGPNGIGKTMIAKNIAHQAVLAGASVRFITASELLNTLAEQDSTTSLRRKLAFFTRPRLLVIDELGYLSYDTRHADLLFEVISRRYENKSVVLTTNKPFGEWGEVFPNAASVVTLVDRLVHRCEIVSIEGQSYRLKESKEAAKKRAGRRAAKKRRA
jgi:DNA replication protein DnaC